jgi:hypothetical protein
MLALMNTLSKTLANSVVLTAAVCVIAAAQVPGKYQTYQNARYGFSIDYPVGWTSANPSENGDGARWTSNDGKSELLVSGRNNVTHESASSLYVQTCQALGGKALYYTSGPSWFVASWNKDGHIHYTKVTVGTGSINDFELTYPTDSRKQDDSLASHLEVSFKHGKLDVPH